MLPIILRCTTLMIIQIGLNCTIRMLYHTDRRVQTDQEDDIAEIISISRNLSPDNEVFILMWELITVHCKHNFSSTAVIPVFAEINPLPGPKVKFTVTYRDAH